MAVDADTVRRVAKLARIATPEARLEPLARELSAILGWVEQLDEVDVAGVAPMSSAAAAAATLREDLVDDGGDPARVLSNAPRSDEGFFVVPQAVE